MGRGGRLCSLLLGLLPVRTCQSMSSFYEWVIAVHRGWNEHHRPDSSQEFSTGVAAKSTGRRFLLHTNHSPQAQMFVPRPMFAEQRWGERKDGPVPVQSILKKQQPCGEHASQGILGMTAPGSRAQADVPGRSWCG